MARKASQAAARRFFGTYTRHAVKHGWEALRRNREYREAVQAFLNNCRLVCPALAERVQRGDFPSLTELVAMLQAGLPPRAYSLDLVGEQLEAAGQAYETARERAVAVADDVLSFHQKWKVFPLDFGLAFEQLPDQPGRGVPPALYGLHRTAWPEMITCPEEDQAALAAMKGHGAQADDFIALQSGESRIAALRAAGWRPPEKITVTVDLQYPLPDLGDRFQQLVEAFQGAREQLLGIPRRTRPPARHWRRIERGWRVWDYVEADKSLSDIARCLGVSIPTVVRDHVLAALRIEQDHPGSVREHRQAASGGDAALDSDEFGQHLETCGQCGAAVREGRENQLCREMLRRVGEGFRPAPKERLTQTGRPDEYLGKDSDTIPGWEAVKDIPDWEAVQDFLTICDAHYPDLAAQLRQSGVQSRKQLAEIIEEWPQAVKGDLLARLEKADSSDPQ